MLHPSYNELMDYVNENAAPQENGEPLVQSRYTLVMAAAKRARQIVEARSKVQGSFTAADKPLSVAVKELYDGEVRILGENEEPDAVIAAEEQAQAEASEGAEGGEEILDFAEPIGEAEEDAVEPTGEAEEDVAEPFTEAVEDSDEAADPAESEAEETSEDYVES